MHGRQEEMRKAMKWIARAAGVLAILVLVGVGWFYANWPHGDPDPVSVATPFVDDPAVIGKWRSVDFVAAAEDFVPGKPKSRGELFLKELTFLPGGKTPQSYWTWTRGKLYHRGDQTTAGYALRTIDGKDYLFLEWMSGDVVLLKMKPKLYVLARDSQPAHNTDVRIAR